MSDILDQQSQYNPRLTKREYAAYKLLIGGKQTPLTEEQEEAILRKARPVDKYTQHVINTAAYIEWNEDVYHTGTTEEIEAAIQVFKEWWFGEDEDGLPISSDPLRDSELAVVELGFLINK